MDINDILAMSGFDDDDADADPGVGAVSFKNMRQAVSNALVRRAIGKPARRPAVRRPSFAPQFAPQFTHPQYVPPTPQTAQLSNMLWDAASYSGIRPQQGGRIEQLGGAPAFFTFGPATAQTATITVIPFKPVKPVRLMVSVTIVGAPGADVLVTNAAIGDRNQLAGAGGVPVASYGPTATLARLSWDIILPQLPLVLTFATTAVPAAATSITIAPSLYVLTMN